MTTVTLTRSPEDYTVVQVPPGASDAERMAAVGTDLSRYPALENREFYAPIPVDTSREIYGPLARNYMSRMLGRVANPSMLTHIVTTRCNYSCGFCSFADTLNAKTSEMDLDEIRKTYESIGDSLNTIVYSGGETTLHRQLPEIIEAAYTYTPVKSVYIISNAWKPDLLFQITHRIKQSCPDLHLTWSLSIEGPREVNNAARHTQKDTWDAWQNTVDTMWGIKQMRERFGYRELDAQLCTVCGPNNVHAMDDWYMMVRDVLQPDKWNLNLLRKSVQMSGHEMQSWESRRQSGKLAPFEAKYREITLRVREDVLSGRLKFLYHTQSGWEGGMKSAVDLISQADNRRILSGESPAICCRAGNDGAYIGSDGTVSGCEEFANNPSDNKAFGNLREVEHDFQAIWHSEAARRYRSQVGKAPECYGCTLESQKNYPSILVSFKHLWDAQKLARNIH
jgi:MoaA/NifB/PqqE/SkfB family radical SAM enzyme